MVSCALANIGSDCRHPYVAGTASRVRTVSTFDGALRWNRVRRNRLPVPVPSFLHDVECYLYSRLPIQPSFDLGASTGASSQVDNPSPAPSDSLRCREICRSHTCYNADEIPAMTVSMCYPVHCNCRIDAVLELIERCLCVLIVCRFQGQLQRFPPSSSSASVDISNNYHICCNCAPRNRDCLISSTTHIV